MDYKGTIEFLYGLYRHGIKLGLESITTAVEALDNPHSRYDVIHIGGTNGKGSTSAILAEILQSSGLRVGLYTSPHLVHFSERIRVNGRLISEREVVELTRRLRAAVPASLTFFEFTTAMAFQYFADEQVDIAVVEVGMGGRFDATNVVTPLGVAITSIAHDHEQYLGETIAEIAFEKAGIIKPRVPVVLGQMSMEATQTLCEIATDRQASCDRFGVEFHVVDDSDGRFRYEGIGIYSHLSCSLIGDHQKHNAGCALALLERIGLKRFGIREATVRTALSQVIWEGRVEILEDKPRLMVDGAHNPAAAETLLATLKPMIRTNDSQLILVLGMMRDKSHAKFLNVLSPFVRHLILTEVDVPRTATIQELKKHVPEGSCVLHESAHAAQALAKARALASPDDVICVTGSLFLAGEVRNLIKGSQLSFSA